MSTTDDNGAQRPPMDTETKSEIERQYMLDVYRARVRFRRRLNGELPPPSRTVALPPVLQKRWQAFEVAHLYDPLNRE